MSTKAFWIYCILILVAFAFMIAVTGCGEGERVPDDKYRACIEKGGSFEDKGYGEYECNIIPQPTATVTVTEGY